MTTPTKSMENDETPKPELKESTNFGKICFEAYWKVAKDFSMSSVTKWEDLPDYMKEPWEAAGNQLILHYEDFILQEFLSTYTGKKDD